MRIFLFLIFTTLLFAFEVEYTKVYTQYIVPQKEAIKIITKKDGLTFPFPYIKTNDGYILYGNIDQINMWLYNEFYAPDDAKFKTIKFAKINFDKIQYKIITKTKQIYKTCKIKKIIFITPDQDKFITKPTNLSIKYKIILKCK
ncbi:hypothetical protein [Nautilia lithotrophica]